MLLVLPEQQVSRERVGQLVSEVRLEQLASVASRDRPVWLVQLEPLEELEERVSLDSLDTAARRVFRAVLAKLGHRVRLVAMEQLVNLGRVAQLDSQDRLASLALRVLQDSKDQLEAQVLLDFWERLVSLVPLDNRANQALQGPRVLKVSLARRAMLVRLVNRVPQVSLDLLVNKDQVDNRVQKEKWVPVDHQDQLVSLDSLEQQGLPV